MTKTSRIIPWGQYFKTFNVDRNYQGFVIPFLAIPDKIDLVGLSWLFSEYFDIILIQLPQDQDYRIWICSLWMDLNLLVKVIPHFLNKDM